MINQVTLVGRLTKDPDLKTTTEGNFVTQITLAVSRNYRNHSGDIETDFISCTLWRKAAENTANYCRKGSVVGVTGRLQTRHYDNREGKRVYVTEVVAETIRFLSAAKPQVVHTEQHPGNAEQRAYPADQRGYPGERQASPVGQQTHHSEQGNPGWKQTHHSEQGNPGWQQTQHADHRRDDPGELPFHHTETASSQHVNTEQRYSFDNNKPPAAQTGQQFDPGNPPAPNSGGQMTQQDFRQEEKREEVTVGI